MKRTDVIQHLIDKYKLYSYLELGTQDKDQNFNKINCGRKMCVDIDPAAKAYFTGSTDKFFQMNQDLQYDIVFIDASHIADDVRKDFENALKVNPKFILLHDVNPETYERTLVPRPTKTGTWNGNAWRFAVSLNGYDDFKFYTVDEDHGVMVVQSKINQCDMLVSEMSWEEFDKNRKKYLNLITWDEFIKL